MKKISKTFYLLSIIIGWGVSIVFSLISLGISLFMLIASKGDINSLADVFNIVGIGFGMYGGIVFMILLYKMWQFIPSNYRRTTPGKAVGFLFIPFFNIYWIFQALWGWAKDFNKFVSKNGFPENKVSEDLALIICILFILTIIPVIGIFISLINFILIIIFLNQAIDKINYIIQHSIK
jgi:hypothetical protein